MTEIKLKESFSKHITVSIARNKPMTLGDQEVFFQVSGRNVHATAAFLPEETYEIIEALARTAGLLKGVIGPPGAEKLEIAKPVKQLTPEEMRFEQLKLELFGKLNSDASASETKAIKHIIKLEKETGKL